MNIHLGKLFAKIEDGAIAAYPVDIQRAFPRTSFPKNIKTAPVGFTIVRASEPPALGLYQIPVEGVPVFVGDEWRQQWSVNEVFPLDGLKTALSTKVDQDAETQRLLHITPGAGQAMEYDQVAVDAAAFAALTVPHEPGMFPMLESTVGVEADTIEEVAAIVLGMNAGWKQIGAAIRRARIEAKQAIQVAETHDDARAVYAAINWLPAPSV